MNLKNLFGFMSLDVAIDLGTANTLISVKDKGILINEPSVVAIDKNTRETLAIGASAKDMIGRTPKDKEAIRPLRDGVIADFELTIRMIDYFMKKINRNPFIRPRVLVAVPAGITPVEKKAVVDTIESAGASKVYLISEPMAAAVGVGIDVASSAGNMIVDIGGGTTEIAVVSLSGTVAASSLKVAGDNMNEAIIDHLKKNFRLIIGENTAEEIKKEIGTAIKIENPDDIEEIEVKGRSAYNPSPMFHRVSSNDIKEALQNPVNTMIEAIKKTFERVPPELSADIHSRGIIMTGGGSMLKGLHTRISQEVNLMVNVAEKPEFCVVNGTVKVLKNLDKYKNLLLPY